MYDFRQVFGIFPIPGAIVTLTRRDVEAIAHLARLEITEEELPVYAGSLSRILGFIDQLSAAATEGVEPMAHPLENQVQAFPKRWGGVHEAREGSRQGGGWQAETV